MTDFSPATLLLRSAPQWKLAVKNLRDVDRCNHP